MYQININLQFCLSNICQWKLFSNELFVSRKGNFIIWQVHLFWHSCRRIHCFLFYWNTADTHTIVCYRNSLAVQWLGLHAVLPTAWVQSLTGELRSYKLHSVAYKNTSMCVCISSVQSLSCVQLFGTPWTAAPQASLSITKSQSLLKLMSIELVMPSNHNILCHPLLLLPSNFPASGSFPMSHFFASHGQSIGSFGFNISLPMNIQDWFPLGLTRLIS